MDIEALLAKFDASDENLVILGEARQRYQRGESMRGLRRPSWAPADSWWSASDRYRGTKRAGSYIGRYLLLRWRAPDSNRLRAKSLGRLDDAAA